MRSFLLTWHHLNLLVSCSSTLTTFGSDPLTSTYQDSTTLNSFQSAIVEKAELFKCSTIKQTTTKRPKQTLCSSGSLQSLEQNVWNIKFCRLNFYKNNAILTFSEAVVSNRAVLQKLLEILRWHEFKTLRGPQAPVNRLYSTVWNNNK